MTDWENLPEKKLPSEWEEITGIQVIDPDGWDRKNYDESWGTPIDHDEWTRRMSMSTIMKINPRTD